MFKNTYQTGFVSILQAGGSRPLAIWGQKVRNGHIRRVTDEDVQTLALEVMGTNVATTYIICPADPKNTLGIRLPFFVMIVKNMKKYFTFEIQIMDDKNMSRRFRVSNYQSTTRVRPFSTSLPIGLNPGWNQIQFNLADFTRRAYGSSYLETMRVQIHANARIKRIYFSDRLYSEDEMPQEFKLFVPVKEKKEKKLVKKEEPEKILVDKATGREEHRSSVTFKQDEVIPSGAPPTPSETARDEEAFGEEQIFLGEELGELDERFTFQPTTPEGTQSVGEEMLLEVEEEQEEEHVTDEVHVEEEEKSEAPTEMSTVVPEESPAREMQGE